MLTAHAHHGRAGAAYTPARRTRGHRRARHPQAAPRQIEVWRLTALGLSDKEIGHAPGITGATAKYHATALRLRLGLSNRVELALAAVHAGLVTRQDIARRLAEVRRRAVSPPGA